MKAPVQIEIFGRKLQIKYKMTSKEGNMGETERSDPPVITIFKDNHQTEEEVFTTVLHELFHASICISGQDELFTNEQEEALVTMLEKALGDVLHLRSSKKVKYREIKFPFETKEKEDEFYV